MQDLVIRPAESVDAGAWLRMRLALWPQASTHALRTDIEAYFAGRTSQLLAVLIATDARGSSVGFAELGIRAYAEGCVTARVAFLEGWYVDPRHRQNGVGSRLVEAAIAWAKTQGCTEFASDVLAHNQVGAAAYRAVGFEEVETIRCFRMAIDASSDQ